MNTLQQAFQRLVKNTSNLRIILVFTGVGAVAALLTFLYVFFVGQNSEHILLRYLLTILFLAGGLVFAIIARNAKDGFAGLAYAILAFFFFFSMLISLIVTLLLFAFFFNAS